MSVNSVGFNNQQEPQSNIQELLKQADNGSQEAIDMLCEGIFNSTAAKFGTDEKFIADVINNAGSKSVAHLFVQHFNNVLSTFIAYRQRL